MMPEGGAMNAAKARVLDTVAITQTFESVTSDPRYQRLRQRLEAVGFFAAAPGGYLWRLPLLGVIWIAAMGALATAPGWPLRVLAWTALAFTMVQGAFMSHEAMHGSISRRPAVNRAMGQLFDSFLIGFSFSYFTRSHTVHHFNCNEEGTDPDTLSTLFSVFESSAREKRGLGRLITRFQYFAIPLLYPTWALAMKWDALCYLVRHRRETRVDWLMIGLHVVTWFGVLPLYIGFGPAFADYLGMSALTGLYLAVLIPVNHVARAVVPHGDEQPFLEAQLTTTRNLGQSLLLDYLFIGLNSHIEHHLFPWVPSSRLRRGRAVVQAFCREEGLPYYQQSYGRATLEVFRHFWAMSRVTPNQAAVAPDAAAVEPAISASVQRTS
jgi:fatty acid desaturase